MIDTVLKWSRDNGISELANLFGLIISVVGFVVTIVGVYKSKNAAVRAAEAAQMARDEIRLFETIIDFSAAITTLEEIKRLHRQSSAWPILPDRYAAIRKLLIQLRDSRTSMSDEQTSVIQNAIVNLVDMEKKVEQSLTDSKSPRSAKFNSIISGDIDALLAVLTQLKTRKDGAPS